MQSQMYEFQSDEIKVRTLPQFAIASSTHINPFCEIQPTSRLILHLSLSLTPQQLAVAAEMMRQEIDFWREQAARAVAAAAACGAPDHGREYGIHPAAPAPVDGAGVVFADSGSCDRTDVLSAPGTGTSAERPALVDGDDELAHKAPSKSQLTQLYGFVEGGDVSGPCRQDTPAPGK